MPAFRTYNAIIVWRLFCLVLAVSATGEWTGLYPWSLAASSLGAFACVRKEVLVVKNSFGRSQSRSTRASSRLCTDEMCLCGVMFCLCG